MIEIITKIVASFLDPITIMDVEILQSGLINQTFKLTTDQGNFILQKMNQKVFPNIHSLLNNKIKITQFLKEKGFATLTFIPTKEGLFFAFDGEDIWQMSVYIPSTIKEKIDSPHVAQQAGEYLAQFHKALLNFPMEELEYTIPDFHNTSKRYFDFLDTIENASTERQVLANSTIESIKRMFSKIQPLANAIQNGIIPMRVVHNDTKISNMLFDNQESIICIIDYDTIMPGSILHDIGDALRTGTNTASEEEKDLTKVNFDSTIFESFMYGYSKEANSFMIKEEAENIHLSLPLLLFEQGCRFLGDYLENDRYYATSYADHNLVRAKTQLHLLEQVGSYLKI